MKVVIKQDNKFYTNLPAVKVAIINMIDKLDANEIGRTKLINVKREIETILFKYGLVVAFNLESNIETNTITIIPVAFDDEYIYSTEREVRALYERIKSGIEVDPNTGHKKVKGLIL